MNNQYQNQIKIVKLFHQKEKLEMKNKSKLKKRKDNINTTDRYKKSVNLY